MRVVVCQTDVAWHDKRANFDRVRQLLSHEDVVPGSLVILPEMFATGFSMDVAAVCESRSRETEAFLAESARDLGIYLLAGLVTSGLGGKGRNEAVAYSPRGEEMARYAKLHPFTYAGEARHYVAGEDIVLFPWGPFTVAPFICYDLRFPEVFRAAALAGANFLAVIANWPAAREEHWTCLLRARAIENQAFVVGANRWGRDPNETYSGCSVVVDPRGAVRAEAAAGEGLGWCDVEVAELEAYRSKFPVLRDIRPEYKHFQVRARSSGAAKKERWA